MPGQDSEQTTKVLGFLTGLTVLWMLSGLAILSEPAELSTLERLQYSLFMGGSYEDVFPILFFWLPFMFSAGGLLGALVSRRASRAVRVVSILALSVVNGTVVSLALLALGSRLTTATCELGPAGQLVECPSGDEVVCGCADLRIPTEELARHDLRHNWMKQVCGSLGLVHAERPSDWQHVWVYVDLENAAVLATCDIECRQNDACDACVPVNGGWTCGLPPVGEQTTLVKPSAEEVEEAERRQSKK